MMRHRVPGPGRWGTHPVLATIQLLTALTVNATTTLFLGGSNVRSWISKVALSFFTLPADADGSVLATVKKWDASAGSAVTISAALDCEVTNMVAKVVKEFAILQTLTDDQRTLDVGDSLYIEFVNNSGAIDTQPVGGVAYVELFALV